MHGRSFRALRRRAVLALGIALVGCGSKHEQDPSGALCTIDIAGSPSPLHAEGKFEASGGYLSSLLCTFPGTSAEAGPDETAFSMYAQISGGYLNEIAPVSVNQSSNLATYLQFQDSGVGWRCSTSLFGKVAGTFMIKVDSAKITAHPSGGEYEYAAHGSVHALCPRTDGSAVTIDLKF